MGDILDEIVAHKQKEREKFKEEQRNLRKSFHWYS